jgi:hypothetical protein
MRKHIALLTGTALQMALFTASPAQSETVSTRIGKLQLENGYPSAASMEKLYEEMEFQRATQAFMWGLPAVASTDCARRSARTSARVTGKSSCTRA